MIPISTFGAQTVAVFGLGGSGLQTAEALMAGGARVIGWDDNAVARDRATAAGIECADLADVDWGQFKALVLAPGVPLTHPEPHWSVGLARAANVEIIGDIELFCRARRAWSVPTSVIAITGTNGKSTTTALTAHVLLQAGRRVQMGGNIGVPVLQLDEPAAETIFVLEISSYQIDLAPSIDPTIGVLLNLTPDHIDRHGTFAHYASVKERLVTASEFAILSMDDPVMAGIHRRQLQLNHKVIGMSCAAVAGADVVFDGRTIQLADGGEFTLDGIVSLRGAHNAQNAMAAIVAGRHCGLSDGELQSGLQSFPGLRHRMEQVGRKGAVAFVNDSKATNADSTEKALLSFDRDIYWIAGGLAKEGGIETLSHCFSRIAKAYLIGEAAQEFAAVLDGVVAYEISATLDQAVATAARDAVGEAAGPAPVVLLSPACASFDQFDNFEERGEVFRALVAGIDGIEMQAEGT